MVDEAAELYLDLLKKILTNVIYQDPVHPDQPRAQQRGTFAYDESLRAGGKDWPVTAHTMVGLKRLDNIQHCVTRALDDGVPGDLIETGVWRGGSVILMRAILKAYGVTDRRVWVADSFEGLPDTGSSGHPLDQAARLHRLNTVLAVPEAEVRRNFATYGLLDEQVVFLPGWFSDTLPTAPIDRLAVLRLDGDMYASTMDSLTHLYPRLSVGGYVIVDDYVIPACRQAVHDYRAAHGIEETIEPIDDEGVCWRRV